MRAVRFEAFGDPSVLEVAEARRRPPTSDGIGAGHGRFDQSERHQDVAGAMKQTKLPRIPGRDYAAWWWRARPNGSEPSLGHGGDVGIHRAGTHAEMIAVPVRACAESPKTLGFRQAASIGANYMAAFCGHRTGGPKAGETVLLIARGGVGGGPPDRSDGRRPCDRAAGMRRSGRPIER